MSSETSTGRTAVRAAMWAFLATASAKLITLAALAVLARLLAPRDFGILAFALAWIAYAETIGDLGSGAALVYWPGRRDDAAQVTLIVNIAAGVTWCVITLAAAPSIAAFFHTPAGAPMMRVIALSFILKYLGNTHDALSQKDLRFRARFIPELSLALVKAAVSIGLALAGFGAWSLVWGHIAGVGIRTILLWLVVDWRPRLRIPRDLLKPMLAYGRGIIAVNVLAAITHHADLAVVGRMLGTTALGLYQLASKIPETTVVVLLSVVSSVLFPAFSRMHAGGESLREPYLQVTRALAAAIFPLAAGLIFLARPLILLFLGERWLGAVPILQALTVCAAVRVLGTHAGDLLKATGRPRLLARLAIVKAAIVLPALLFGARFGAAGVARALAIAAALGTAIALAVASRVLRVRLASMLGASLPGIAGAAMMSLPLLAWTWWSAARLPPLVQLLGGTALGATVFAAALLILDRELVRSMRTRFLPRRMTYGAIGRFLLPMGEPLVRRWFDRTLYAPPGIRARVRRLAGGPRLRRTAESAEIGAMRALLAEVADAVPRGPAIFVHDYDTSDRGRVVAFFFREGDSAPCVMAKAEFGASALPAEAETLEHLRATLPAELLSTLPRVLRSHASARGEILLTTVLPGCSSYVQLTRSLAPSRLFAQHFAIAGRWLAAFHRATRTATVSIIDGIEVPHSAAHGDFWPHNVLHDEDDAVGVVDWEHCLRDASPFLDVFHYALTYGISHFRRLRAEEAFRRTFHADDPLARAVQQYLRDYAARAGLPQRVLAPAFETFVATRGRMTEATPPRPGAFWRSAMECGGLPPLSHR